MSNTISGCLIVKNEEDFLEECLQMLSEFVDEIVIVDNGSEDSSVDIAKRYGAKILSVPEANHDGGRNVYLENASCDWILTLDADERIFPQDGKKLKKELSKISNGVAGLILPRYEYIGQGEWACARLCRVYRNLKKIRYNNSNVHASVVKETKQCGEIIKSDIAIHHLDILKPQRASQKRKRNIKRIKTEIEQAIYEQVEYNPYLHCFLGLEYAALGDYEQAEKEYGKVVFHPDSEVVSLALTFLMQNCMLQKDYNRAELYAKRLLQMRDVHEVQALFTLMQLSDISGKLEEAIAICHKLISVEPYLAHWYLDLATLYIKKNAITEAKKSWDKAVQLNPYINESLIYKEGDKPNIFLQQTVFLQDYYICIKKFKNKD